MILQKASSKAIKYACTHFHYSKSIPSNPVGYSVFNGGEVKNEAFCGVIVFSRGANRLIGSPYTLRQGQVIELTRVALNGKQESTSKAISIALRLIKKDVPLCKLVISYADCDQNHIGTIYQATNWYFTGLVQKNRLFGFMVNGKKKHKKSVHSLGIPQNIENVRKYLDPKAERVITRGKLKYIYPLDKSMIKLCKELSRPYPKKEDFAKLV